jgi:cytochrome oxidase assembly protein ShyY1
MNWATSIRRRAVPWVAAVAGVVACVSLAQWQTRRAQQKLDIERAWIAAEAREPTPLAGTQALAQVERSLPQRVLLRGSFRDDRTVWVGNRIHEGRPGLYAITPLVLDGGAGVVLVNRGWLARQPAHGAALPSLPAAGTGTTNVVGLAVSHVPRIAELGVEPRDLSAVWSNLDYRRYERASGLAVASFVVQQTSDAPDGLVRSWMRPATGVDKHRGYVLQWYALAALITVLTVVFAVRAWRRGHAAVAAVNAAASPGREGA